MKGLWDSTSIIFITFSLFFFFTFGAVFSDLTSKHLCPPEQRYSLLEFKNEFKIGNCVSYDGTNVHRKIESWTNNSDCCNWEGITCKAELGEVLIELNLGRSCLHSRVHSNSSFLRLQNLHFLTTLDLSNNYLTGLIPSSIGNLSHLNRLYLNDNQFSGPIPISIGNLTCLTNLDLSFNQFSGPIPSSIGNLTYLTTLYLSFNQFSGLIPYSIGKLSRLTDLYFYYNQFSGQIPSSIGNLSHLTNLFLSFNHLSGQIPSSIGKLYHLTNIPLSSNQFLGPIPYLIGNLSYLYNLDISHNQFSGQIPYVIGNLYNLGALYLSSNQLSGQIPSTIKNLSGLYTLDISNNKIEGQIPSYLWMLPNLEYLELSNNILTGFERSSKHGHSSIKGSSILKNFFGSNNNITDNIPSSICSLRSLITLDLSENNINGPIPKCMGNLKSTLSDLNLRHNSLSGSLPEDIFGRLRSLDVGHNNLLGKLPRSLIRCSFLEVLNVESNIINDTFPFWLSSLQELQVLVLRSNVFHGPIHHASFPKLRIIDISHNQFNGTLASDYFVKWNAMSTLGKTEDQSSGKYMGSEYYVDKMVLMNKGVEMELIRILKIYTSIDFSGNKIEGEIPRSIGILKELHILNLSKNAFSGHIPSSMGNLTALESLDVGQNNLSGEIPIELGSLSFLEYMNFSHNQLKGLVPGGTQFRTQPCSSFQYNMGLFGLSLDEACGNIHMPEPKKTLESEEEKEEEVISWIAAGIGFGPGLVFGLSVGYIWFFHIRVSAS